ncbi:type 2 lanthipeptide synthetase LanM [Bacillus toyonensis]|uniref:type 2 lanthipeptide synthetase LanM n=1 Tax=Bacillus toyonensis TaxID=155322 RepID=UPI000BF3EDA5|nr:type 2 lanthipeptide synthetase LanM [Bacillus toyonensis]PGC84372.1 type 2 lantipeptide synthetase LanM [Bacillus toyonensis]
MSSLQNLLCSFERKQEKNNNKGSSLFQKNIELIYKNDHKSLEKSIETILPIGSIEELKSIYTCFSSKSAYKLNTFRTAQKKIAAQSIDYPEDNNNLFSSYLHKVSSYWKNEIIRSKRYQQTKHCIYDEATFWKDLEQQFQKQIYRLSYRTLVFDFHINKQGNRLHGNTDMQKMEYYNRELLRNSDYMVTFFEKYPCILRILANEMRKNRKGLVELLRRYQEDRHEISYSLFHNTRSTKIKRIDIGMGDAHCDGRKTTKLYLEEGKLFYKPRNTTPESMYDALMHNWNTNINSEKYKIKTPSSIMKKNYSWIEYISYHPCTKQEEINTFYKRMGVQIAFLYACNATDFHFENIIANKDYPVFIDMECLFHINIAAQANNVHATIQQKIATSVYSLGILPVSLGENNVDISGLGQSGCIQSVGKVPQLKADKMRIERDYIQFRSAATHRPEINGNDVLVYEYLEDIMHGFTLAYTYIQDRKEEILRIIDAHKESLVIRYVPRPTRIYASILSMSIHPRFLHNSLDRELVIAKFCKEGWSTTPQRELGNMEFLDLMNGDIPYFTNQITSTNLVTARGKKISNFFPVSPYYSVKQKIQHLNGEDLQFQLQIIENSLALTKTKVQDNVWKTIALDPTNYSYKFEQKDFFIKTAEEIADYLYTIALTEENGEKRQISWLNLSINDTKFDIQAMDDNLYKGLSGMALMYLSMWIVTKNMRYLEIAENIMYGIMDRVDDIAIDDSTLSIGAFNGIASILYTLLSFYQFSQKSIYIKYAKKTVRLIQYRLQDDTNLDMIDGVAGALIVLMRYYELTTEKEILDMAKLCGEFLIQKANHFTDQEVGWIGRAEKALTGFSHGNAGIIYALHLLNKQLKSKDIDAIIKKGMKFEDNHIVDNQWIDLRKADTKIDACVWCHGSAGILLSRLELQNSEDEYISMQSKKDIERALSNILRFGFGTVKTGKSICHGVLGNALVMMEYGKGIQDRAWDHISKNVMYESIKKLKVEQWKKPMEENIQGLGLLTGLAGIAYGLLYACDQRLPNVITLELGKLISNEIGTIE